MNRTVGVVLWSGEYGGAETWSLSLARALARRGNQVGVLIVGSAGPLCNAPSMTDLRVTVLGHGRGRDVIWSPTALARAARGIGADVAILPSAGFLCAALRVGGYRGKVIAIEHGSLRNLRSVRWPQRAIRLASELGGVWMADAQVAPSEFMRREAAKYPHAKILQMIYPGLDLSVWGRGAPGIEALKASRTSLKLGFGGRLIPGKGVDVLLRAVAHCRSLLRLDLEIAGDGPERASLESLAAELGVAAQVRFRGWVRDMPSFWRSRDLAVVPSYELEESFGMVAAEAMACGLPVLATRNGGLEEVVQDGITGALFPAGDWQALAQELDRYAADPNLLAIQASAAIRHARATFDINRCAEEFTDLIQSLLRHGASGPGPHSSGGPELDGVLAS